MTTLTVTSTLQWLDRPVEEGVVALTCRVPAGLPATEGAAVIAFAFAGPVSAEELRGSGLFMSKVFGPFLYLEGAAGETAFAAEVRLPRGHRLERIGFKLWNHAEPIEVEALEISLTRPAAGFWVNISVDVEALPHRAAADHISRLIYGRCGGGEHGIGAQMQLFRDRSVPATFYLECGQAAHYGPEAVQDVGRSILDGGFDLQLHLHAEELVRGAGWPWPPGLYPSLENLNYRETKRAMGYAVDVFGEAAGRAPQAFRAGSYQFNRYTLQAGAALGLQVFSNYRTDYATGNTYEFEGDRPIAPFRWTNGIYELPVTISPEPLSTLTPETVWSRILQKVDGGGTWFVNLVIHSWSFLRRNERGHNELPDPLLADNLRRIIDLAPARARFVSIAETVEALATGTRQINAERNPNQLVRRQKLPLPQAGAQKIPA